MKKILSASTLGMLASFLPLRTHAAVTISGPGPMYYFDTADTKTAALDIVAWMLGLLCLIIITILIYSIIARKKARDKQDGKMEKMWKRIILWSLITIFIFWITISIILIIPH